MQDFYVLVKQINLQNFNDFKKISIDYVQVSYLIQEAIKEDGGLAQRWSEYEIDETSVKTEVVGSRLCVVMIAYRKSK